MRYFKLLLDDSDEEDIIGICNETYDVGKNDIQKGQKLLHWDDRITFYYDPLKGEFATDYLANNIGWFLASTRLLNVIEKLTCEFEQKPILIKSSVDGSSLERYYVVNILDIVDALCLEKSEYSVYEVKGMKVYSIRKHTLKEKQLNNKHLFRLLGYEGAVFVSEPFMNEVLNNGITECDFLEVNVV